MRVLQFLSACALCALLAACGKTVQVVQPDQFKLMADRMPAELEARGLIDSARDYRPALGIGARDDYGAVLYARLAPDFLFEDMAQGAPSSFAAGLTPRQSARMRPAGFSITEPRRTLHVDMVAVADWDDSGTDDWIIAATIERAGLVQRVYYVVVQNPAEEGTLRATPVAVYEDLGITGKLYVRDGKAPVAAGKVEETVPGLRPVTEPPEKNPAKKAPTSGVKERNL